MDSPILVNHAALGHASSRLQAAGSAAAEDSQALNRANAELLANWQGAGSAAFSAAAASLEGYLLAASLVIAAESLALSGADSGFADQDAALATNIGSSGQ